MSHKGWIGVDLDGTLAKYERWVGYHYVGPPVPAMLQRVRRWLKKGCDVRIFTARVGPKALRMNNITVEQAKAPIDKWCIEHLGFPLPITNEKDLDMVECWDDRCIQVVPNTGARVDGSV